MEDIQIEKYGKILEGKDKGGYVYIQNDAINTGGYLIIVSRSGSLLDGYDGWVEDLPSLQEYFKESNWKVKWLKTRPLDLEALFCLTDHKSNIIKKGTHGLILEGDCKDGYVLIEDDTTNTGGYFIRITSSQGSFPLDKREDWVENARDLRNYFEHAKWKIKWPETEN